MTSLLGAVIFYHLIVVTLIVENVREAQEAREVGGGEFFLRGGGFSNRAGGNRKNVGSQRNIL